MEITFKEREGKGYVIARKDGHKIGLMTYRRDAEDLITILHTEVNPDTQEKGVAKKILNTVVDKAREDGFKIIPICPFAKAQFEKTPEIQDVLKNPVQKA